MIVDVPNSGVALAVSQITKDKDKVFLASGPGSSDLTGKACTPNTVHWTYDTWMLANGTGTAIIEARRRHVVLHHRRLRVRPGARARHRRRRDEDGGKVLGGVRAPINTQDFSSFLLQAQSSKAKVIGLANAGGDTTNSIKQAAEFGIVKGGQSLAGLLVFLTDMHALGLRQAQGLIFTKTFYWDMNDQTRAFSKRFAPQDKGIHPTMVHAGVYASVLHYLKAVEALKSDDGTKVVAKMKELPTDDPLFGKGSIRVDGRKIHPAYLVEVKKPAESKASVGLLQDPRDDPGRPGVPAADRRRLLAREVTSTRGRPADARRSPGHVLPRDRWNLEVGLMQALFGQLLIGLINGAFYAMLSLGLAVIFGLLNIINFTHGAQYMMGAFVAWLLLMKSLARHRLLVGAAHRADRRRRHRRRHRADDAFAPLQARPPVRIAAHVRPGARHPGPVPQRVRLVRTALSDPVAAARAASTSDSCSCRSIAPG